MFLLITICSQHHTSVRLNKRGKYICVENSATLNHRKICKQRLSSCYDSELSWRQNHSMDFSCTCQHVQRLPNSAALCHVNKAIKFRGKIHSKWKMWKLKFKEKVSIDAEDSQVYLWYCFVYHYRYFSFIEAVNLEQTLTVQ